MFALVDTSALLSQEVLCPSSPQVWLRTSQSLTRDLQHAFCSPPALGTHQSHQTSSLCGLVNIRRASWLIVVVALILLVQLVPSSQGSAYRQWPVGLVRPQRVFKHIESTRVEWPWHCCCRMDNSPILSSFSWRPTLNRMHSSLCQSMSSLWRSILSSNSWSILVTCVRATLPLQLLVCLRTILA